MAFYYVFLLATARFIGGSSLEPCALKEWLYESSAWAPPGYHVSLGNTKRLVKGSLVGLGKIYSIEKKKQTFFFAPLGKTFCPVWLFDLFWLAVPSFFSLEIFEGGKKSPLGPWCFFRACNLGGSTQPHERLSSTHSNDRAAGLYFSEVTKIFHPFVSNYLSRRSKDVVFSR